LTTAAGLLLERTLLRLPPLLALRVISGFAAARGVDPRHHRARLITAALGHPAPAGRYGSVLLPYVGPPLTPPVILTTLHLGPLTALAYFLERLPGDVLALHRWSVPPRPGVRMLEVSDSSAERAGAFLAGYRALRMGETIFLALDGGCDSCTSIVVSGRRVVVARGPFALSRMTGAPLVFIGARWARGRVEVVAGAPVAAADESDMVAALAPSIEAFLSLDPDPSDLFARALAQSPLAEGTAAERLAQPGVTDLAVGRDGDGARCHDHDSGGTEAEGRDDLV
jgi:hypothetical protein